MRSRFGVVVATRRLWLEESEERTAVVKIGKPRKMKGGDWECPFQISGLGMRKIEYGHGVDAMQALVQAIEGIRVRLEQAGMPLTWEGGESGSTGFTRFVPSFYGHQFSKRLERLIEKEIERFAHNAEARHKKRNKTD